MPPPSDSVKILPAPITAPAATNAPTRPMISPPTRRECLMKLAPSRSRKRRLGCSSLVRLDPVPADLADEEHHDRADQEGGGVQVQREVHRLGAEEVEVPGQDVRDERQHREQAGTEHRREPVGGDQAELVGRLDLIAAHQVRHGRVLGGHPEQAHALDQEAGDQQPGQRLPVVDEQVRQRDRQEQPEPDDVRDHHRHAPVEAVGEHAGERAEHDRGQQLDDEHAAECVVLRLVAVRKAGGERGRGEQPEPVAETRQRGGVPEPTERGHPEHATDRTDGRHCRRRHRRAGPRPRPR